MPIVAGFRGLHYSHQRFSAGPRADRVRAADDDPAFDAPVADVSDVVCPPYDVIDRSQQQELLARDARNAVRLELSAEPDPHSAAAHALREWRVDGTLERRDEPTAYYYRHATAAAPDELTVEGVVARVRLEPWGAGVRPHERTMPGPKADRLALLRATATQLSPILVVYFDRSARYRHVMGRSWDVEWRARDADGLLHQLAAIEPDDRLLGYLSRQALFVADGHHRYETALAYRREVRSERGADGAPEGSLGADWIMVQLVNAELSEVEIRPTHRLVLDADRQAVESLASTPGVSATPVAPSELAAAVEASRDRDAPVFGLALADAAWLLECDAEVVASRLRREPMSPAVRRLDLAALHVALLGDVLGIPIDAAAAEQRLAYTRDAADAIRRVADGEAAAAIIVRPTRIEQLADVANAGDVMPQKSTYFYPKLLTGMAFHPLGD